MSENRMGNPEPHRPPSWRDVRIRLEGLAAFPDDDDDSTEEHPAITTEEASRILQEHHP